MKPEKYISVQQLSVQYSVEQTFFDQLHELGLVELQFDENTPCIDIDHLQFLEKIMRLHHELQLNMEGIDVVCHLLRQIEQLKTELAKTRSRLNLYEH